MVSEGEFSAKGARLLTLDALRGLAVMGILAVNIVAFAMPDMAYITPNYRGAATEADKISWLASLVLVDGKMRGLFSLLFGASMLLILERAEAKGESEARVHYRRMAWLALFGLAHFFFIWWGDILFLYAAVGSIAFLFKDMDARGLIKIALVIYSIGFLLACLYFGGLLFLQFAAGLPDAGKEVTEAFADMMRQINSADKQLAVYTGSYGGIVAYKFAEQWFAPLTSVFMNIFEILTFMMIGMALYKNGFLAGEADRAVYRKWAAIGVIVGGVGYLALGWLAARHNHDVLISMNVILAWSYPFRLLMMIGYAAILVMLFRRFADSAIVRRIAAAGRAAFTNYLGTSIVMTTIFYGYGFGLFEAVPRTQLWFYAAGMWALMLLWSKPWLDRFHYGPLEWLWRSLARGERQPFRR